MKIKLCFMKSVTVFRTVTVKAVNASSLRLFARKSGHAPENCCPRQHGTNRCSISWWQDITINVGKILNFFLSKSLCLLDWLDPIPSIVSKHLCCLFPVKFSSLLLLKSLKAFASIVTQTSARSCRCDTVHRENGSTA